MLPPNGPTDNTCLYNYEHILYLEFNPTNVYEYFSFFPLNFNNEIYTNIMVIIKIHVLWFYPHLLLSRSMKPNVH